MMLSIVTTMYCSAPYIMEFYERMTKTASAIIDDFEIIFVNDGSPDNSLEVAIGLYRRDPKVKVLDLSRNFGHHKAMMTGLAHAEGEYIFLLDSDLEEKPETLADFWRELHISDNIDVVFGQQQKRKGDWLERMSGNIFYKTFNSLSATKVPENLVTARLMKRGYVKALIDYREQELFLAGIWADAGFNQKAIRINKASHSPSTYSFAKKMSVLVNSITSFTSKPLIYIFYLGSFISASAFLFVIYILYRKIFSGFLVGWTSIVASIWLVGGVIIFSIGVLGVYLSKIFNEVKNRPYTIVKRYYSQDN